MVDRGGLENRCAFTGTVGSNPTLSAMRACWPEAPVSMTQIFALIDAEPAVIQDFVRSMETPDGGYTNERSIPVGSTPATAAAVSSIRAVCSINGICPSV